MRVRLLRDWRWYRAGRVLEPGDGVANVLIRRGIAAAVDEAPAAETPRPRRRTKRKGDDDE